MGMDEAQPIGLSGYPEKGHFCAKNTKSALLTHRDPEYSYVQTKITDIFFTLFFSLKILLGYCQTLSLSPSWTLNPQYGGPGGPKPLQTPQKQPSSEGWESIPPIRILDFSAFFKRI